METSAPKTRLRIRVVFDDIGMVGPGKMDLLEGIARTGSIAAAGRDMGMSYKRAWQLVETMNGMFRAPVVSRSRGGPGGGGAALTPTGEDVLRTYRAFEKAAQAATAPHSQELAGFLRDPADAKPETE